MSKIVKAIKKPIEVEAVLFDVEKISIESIHNFCKKHNLPMFPARCVNGASGAGIDTLEGSMIAETGDWIIKGINGEFYPCKPDIFEKTYNIISTTYV
jgi:hypothetical protein